MTTSTPADKPPEESPVLSDLMGFETKPSPAPPGPSVRRWLIPVIVLVLVVLGGVLVLLLPGDEPPPSPPPGPPVHRSGELTIYDDGPYDLDELNPVHRIELTEEVEL